MTRSLSIIFSILLIAALPALASPITGIAAIVNDEVITTLELNREMAQLLKQSGKKQPVGEEAQKFRKSTIEMLIDKKLVQQKAREMGIVVKEEELKQSIEELKRQSRMSQEDLLAALADQGLTLDQYRAKIREQLEVLRLMSIEVNAKIQVSDRDKREYYDANPALFNEPGRFRARHIFFRIPAKASNEEIKRIMARAAGVVAEAAEGKDFVELAKKYSDDPKAAGDGGSLLEFRKGEMLPEIEQAVINMKPGEVSELISTPSGVHIIKLEEKLKPGVKSFTDAKGQIEESLLRKKSEERFQRWMEDLRKNSAIDIKPLAP